MYWFVIPARKGSKGLPLKNRKLFKYTADTIPAELKTHVIVSSDDEEILKISKSYGFKSLNRDEKNSSDTSSTRDVLIDVAKKFNIPDSDFIVLLYLVYPDRKWETVENAISFIEKNNSTSLLCKKEVKCTPYLIFFEEEDHKGTKVINHDLCRRQDYRKCFSLSHYVGIFQVKILESLDTNTWMKETIFFPIESWVDVDTEEDLENFLNK